MTQLPSYLDFEIALEKVVRERGRIMPTLAYEMIADCLQLTPTQREIMVPNKRERKFHNIIQWGREKLAKRGIIDRRYRGIWVLKSD